MVLTVLFQQKLDGQLSSIVSGRSDVSHCIPSILALTVGGSITAKAFMWTLHSLAVSIQERLTPNEGPGIGFVRGSPCASQRHGSAHEASDPFSVEDIARFPVLAKRNLWCMQRHQATAHHYDLRLRVGNELICWAIPKGVMEFKGNETRLAVQTTVHPLSYAMHEGKDPIPGRGTRKSNWQVVSDFLVLWDLGEYTIEEPFGDSESQVIRHSDDSGAFEEEKLRSAMNNISRGQQRSIRIVLKGGAKLQNQERNIHFTGKGAVKKEWFLRMHRGDRGLSWGPGGENWSSYGMSVKSGRPFSEIVGPETAI